MTGARTRACPLWRALGVLRGTISRVWCTPLLTGFFSPWTGMEANPEPSPAGISLLVAARMFKSSEPKRAGHRVRFWTALVGQLNAPCSCVENPTEPDLRELNNASRVHCRRCSNRFAMRSVKGAWSSRSSGCATRHSAWTRATPPHAPLRAPRPPSARRSRFRSTSTRTAAFARRCGLFPQTTLSACLRARPSRRTQCSALGHPRPRLLARRRQLGSGSARGLHFRSRCTRTAACAWRCIFPPR